MKTLLSPMVCLACLLATLCVPVTEACGQEPPPPPPLTVARQRVLVLPFVRLDDRPETRLFSDVLYIALLSRLEELPGNEVASHDQTAAVLAQIGVTAKALAETKKPTDLHGLAVHLAGKYPLDNVIIGYCGDAEVIDKLLAEQSDSAKRGLKWARGLSPLEHAVEGGTMKNGLSIILQNVRINSPTQIGINDQLIYQVQRDQPVGATAEWNGCDYAFEVSNWSKAKGLNDADDYFKVDPQTTAGDRAYELLRRGFFAAPGQPRIGLYSQAGDAGLNTALVHRLRAQTHAASNDVAQCLNALNQALLCEPENHYLYLLRAMGYAAAGQLELADADLGKARRLQPQAVKIYVAQAQLHARRGDLQAALEAIQQAIRLQPDNTTHYRMRIEAYVALKQYDQALADIATCRQLGDDIPQEVEQKIRSMIKP